MSLSTVSNLEDSKSISTKKVPEASPGGTKSISKRLITRGTVPASPTKSEAASSVVSSRSASISSLDGNTSLKSISVATIKYYKSLRLPHEMLIDLNLQPGMNTVSFTVTTRLQGSATCDAHIYLWPNDARVVISDVDGTITKSDVMGHLMYTVGRDWTHSDIANLYTRIAKNGYRFLYLTSRCLGLAASTRGLIKGVKQSQFTLPDGPVITSPDRMLAVLRREVILGNPQEFKIACLKDLQALFNPSKSIDILLSSDLNKKDLLMTKQQGVLVGSQSERSIKREFVSSKNQQSQDLVYNSNNELDSLGCIRTPFYAGFGNRATDSMAYHAVGVPKSRVFIVNPAGNVSIAPIADRFSSSYARLLDLVDSIFPPLAIDNQCFRDHTTRLSHSIPIDTDSEGIAKSKNIPRSNQTVHHDEAFSDFWYWRINNGTTTKMMTALPNIGEQPLETVNMVSENVMTSHEDEEEAVPLTPSFFTG